MRVAVVTGTWQQRLDWLQQCHDSVRAQKHPCTHIIVSDGGAPNPLKDFEGQFIQLHHRHNDSGDTPRAVGALSAFSQRFDAVCWLDDDNWFYPEHVATLVQLHEKTRAPVCSSIRDIYHRGDDRLLLREGDINGDRYIDANCYLITRAVAGFAAIWTEMPPAWHECGDIYFWHRLRELKVKMAHVNAATVAYRANRINTYLKLGLEPPPGAKDGEAAWQKLIELGYVKGPGAPRA